ncbi:hypothetical protein IFM89_028631 [Coptis chinensis]|uniref:pectinesterase n=1 Tax=Coptis chinensis TaxID=261450 RepID=A0A835M232_9MAGN|nr:hypothetical protein IFM89_028631 [Coptis chinensis]
MNSINTLKGYDKVGHVEDQSSIPKKNPKHKLLIILIPALILLTAIICLTATLIIHNTSTTKSKLPKSNSITAVCSLTNYPQSCISSLQNSTSADPEQLFKLYLQVSVHSLKNLSAVPQQLIIKVNDPRVKSALLDCESLFNDAVEEIKGSMSLMNVGQGEKMLTVNKINYIKTWISGAMTNLETCLDGLDEMDSSLHDVMKTSMVNSNEFLSNSLAIVGKIDLVLDQFHLTMH